MPKWKLDYHSRCDVSLKVDLDGRPLDVPAALVDTGFCGGDFGLKLPLGMVPHAGLPTTDVGLANDVPVACPFMFGVRIIAIQNKILKKPIETAVVFMAGEPIVGVPFLRSFRINLNGPKGEATMKL